MLLSKSQFKDIFKLIICKSQKPIGYIILYTYIISHGSLFHTEETFKTKGQDA